LHPDGRCFEATMADCRALRGRFQGPGTSCGGYQQPIVMSSEYNAPEGQVFREPSSIRDPRLKGDTPPKSVTSYLSKHPDTPPKSVTSYLSKHPEVANLYDDDDASVMMKGVIIGCLIGAVGTIFGNLASEMIVDRWKIHPDFVWDKD